MNGVITIGLLVFLLCLSVLALCIGAYFGMLLFRVCGFQLNDKQRQAAIREREDAEQSRLERSMAGRILGGGDMR